MQEQQIYIEVKKGLVSITDVKNNIQPTRIVICDFDLSSVEESIIDNKRSPGGSEG